MQGVSILGCTGATEDDGMRSVCSHTKTVRIFRSDRWPRLRRTLQRIFERMVVSERARKRLELVAIVAVVLAAGFVQQPPGDNQTAHLALVKALADGTPGSTGYQEETADDSYIDGHFYTAQGPGLAPCSPSRGTWACERRASTSRIQERERAGPRHFF